MNKEVGSIMSYFYYLFPVKIYDKNVPKEIETPSLYFPEPITFGSNDTLSTFSKTFSLSVKLFHKNSQLAYDEAERIADAIRRNRGLIPLLNLDGSDTNDFIRLKRIEERVTDGFALISLNWDSRYYYDREEWPSLENFSIDSGVR
ncbi:phage portal protein [Heyndrickxia sporothermodurans]